MRGPPLRWESTLYLDKPRCWSRTIITHENAGVVHNKEVPWKECHDILDTLIGVWHQGLSTSPMGSVSTHYVNPRESD